MIKFTEDELDESQTGYSSEESDNTTESGYAEVGSRRTYYHKQPSGPVVKRTPKYTDFASDGRPIGKPGRNPGKYMGKRSAQGANITTPEFNTHIPEGAQPIPQFEIWEEMLRASIGVAKSVSMNRFFSCVFSSEIMSFQSRVKDCFFDERGVRLRDPDYKKLSQVKTKLFLPFNVYKMVYKVRGPFFATGKATMRDYESLRNLIAALDDTSKRNRSRQDQATAQRQGWYERLDLEDSVIPDWMYEPVRKWVLETTKKVTFDTGFDHSNVPLQGEVTGKDDVRRGANKGKKPKPPPTTPPKTKTPKRDNKARIKKKRNAAKSRRKVAISHCIKKLAAIAVSLDVRGACIPDGNEVSLKSCGTKSLEVSTSGQSGFLGKFFVAVAPVFGHDAIALYYTTASYAPLEDKANVGDPDIPYLASSMRIWRSVAGVVSLQPGVIATNIDELPYAIADYSTLTGSRKRGRLVGLSICLENPGESTFRNGGKIYAFERDINNCAPVSDYYVGTTHLNGFDAANYSSMPPEIKGLMTAAAFTDTKQNWWRCLRPNRENGETMFRSGAVMDTVGNAVPEVMWAPMQRVSTSTGVAKQAYPMIGLLGVGCLPLFDTVGQGVITLTVHIRLHHEAVGNTVLSKTATDNVHQPEMTWFEQTANAIRSKVGVFKNDVMSAQRWMREWEGLMQILSWGQDLPTSEDLVYY